MKNKYERMNKKEKKELIKEYKNTKNGKSFYKNYYYCITTCIICIIYCLYMIIDAYINKLSKGYYYYGILVSILSIAFIISVNRKRKGNLNKYAINKDKN